MLRLKGAKIWGPPSILKIHFYERQNRTRNIHVQAFVGNISLNMAWSCLRGKIAKTFEAQETSAWSQRTCAATRLLSSACANPCKICCELLKPTTSYHSWWMPWPSYTFWIRVSWFHSKPSTHCPTRSWLEFPSLRSLAQLYAHSPNNHQYVHRERA